MWCKFSDIAQSNIGLTYKPTDISEKGIPVLRSNNIQNDKLFLEDLVRVSCKVQEKNYITNGDILICARNGSRNLLGKSAIIKDIQEPMVFGAFMAICRSDYNNWIFQILRTNYFQRYLDNSNSTAINQITQSMLLNFLIPLPPLAEQQRIVEKIEEIFALIDNLQENKTALQNLIKQTKTKVLDMATRGQLLDNTTADNGHYTNKNNDFPFQIPKNWQWKKLGEVCHFENGFAFNSNDYAKKGVPLIRISNIQNNTINLEDCIFINKKVDEKFIVKKGDLLIAMSGATTGKMGNYNLETEAYLNQRIGNIRIKDENILNSKFRDFFMLTKSDEILKMAYGGAQPNISGKMINSLFIALPPLAEQQKIVQKIEKIFAELENIEKMLGE